MNTIQKIGKHIFHNIDVYITIVVALGIAILSVLGIVNQTVVLSAVLATLALVSLSLLSNRRDNERIRNAVSQLETATLSEKFFNREYNRTELQEFTRQSNKLFMWGLNFTRTIPLLKDDFEQGLAHGLELKILMIKPESHAVKMTAFRNRDQNEKRINAVLYSNLSTLSVLSSKASSGTIEVRVVDYVPPFTVLAFNPHLPIGEMFVRLITFRIPNELRPTFKLSNSRDVQWFNFFKQQFETVWEEAEPINLDEYRT